MDKILAITPKLVNYVVNCGASPKKVDLLLLGVNTDQFKPNIDTKICKEKLLLTEHDKIIVFIGIYDFLFIIPQHIGLS